MSQITIVKLDAQGQTKVQYQGDLIKQSSHEIVIKASWTLPARDLGYVQFEPGDRFREHYYTDRWFNIFDIASIDGKRKGWYCNITEPARIFADRIEQVDLFLDVWVSSEGKPLILDEDEFTEATTLSDEQRHDAQRGLQALLHMLEARQEVFADITTAPSHFC